MRLLSRAILIVCLMSAAAFAGLALDPTEIGIGSRPLGMGKAYTAVSDDGSAIFTNPAGLDFSKNLKFISMSGQLMSEVPYVVFGASRPLLSGTFGIGYSGFGIAGIQETTLSGNTPEATGNVASYSNTAINLSYATEIERVVLLNKLKEKSPVLRDAKFGGNIKFVTQAYSGAASFETGNASGIDLDLGYLKQVSNLASLGIFVKNIFPGNNISSDDLPTTIIAGLTRKIPERNLLLALDLEYNRTILIHAGGEWNPLPNFLLRCGLDQKPSAGKAVNNISGGVGLKLDNGTHFDYTYHTYSDVPDLATHYFSLGFAGKEFIKK